MHEGLLTTFSKSRGTLFHVSDNIHIWNARLVTSQYTRSAHVTFSFEVVKPSQSKIDLFHI